MLTNQADLLRQHEQVISPCMIFYSTWRALPTLLLLPELCRETCMLAIPSRSTESLTSVEASYYSVDWCSPNACLFTPNKAKINYVIGVLRGRVLVWAQASSMTEHHSALCFEGFIKPLE